MVERSFDPSEFGPDPSERRRESERQQREQARRDDERRRAQERDQSMRRMMEVVNDIDLTVDREMVKAINDPEMVMTSNGDVARVTRRTGLGSGGFSSQFASTGIPLPTPKKKTSRKSKAKRAELSKAFEKANEMARKKRGKGFKKGWNQSRIASTAHRLVRQGRV